MKEYMPYEGANDPFSGVDLAAMLSADGDDGELVFDPDKIVLNEDTVKVPTLPIREPVVFEAMGEEVTLLADVTHNLMIGCSFSCDDRDNGAERGEELDELFAEFAVASFAYRKRLVFWQN